MSKIMTVSEIEDSDNNIDVGETKIVGFEYKRSDTAQVTKDLQKSVLTDIVTGESNESIRESVFEAGKEIERRYPDWERIGIPGGIGKDLDDYKSDTAQVRAAKTSNKLLGTSFGKDDKPKRIYLEEKTLENNDRSERTDVIAFDSGTELRPIENQLYVDTARMRKTIIKKPMQRILDPLGIEVDAALNGRVQKGIADWV